MTISEQQLLEQADKLDKALGTEEKKETEKSIAKSLTDILGDAMTVIKSFGKGRKEADADDDEEKEKARHEDHEDGDVCKSCGYGVKPVKKSGEREPEHGDQKKYRGGGDSPRRIKVMNYDEKTGTGEIENVDGNAYGNSKAEYYESQRNVHKGLSERLDDPDLTDDDKVLIVNEFIEETAKSVDTMDRKLDAVMKGVGALINVMKSFVDKGDSPRGRVSKLSLVDKALGGGKEPAQKGLDWNMIMKKALDGQREGKLDMNAVSLLEAAKNDPGAMPHPAVFQILQRLGIEPSGAE